ncbi:hypothetical protein Egran_00042 [Elaphomyces granulatus]|uniref:Uncharacterized protein n=1 Tax=Elaphomyces granulatus TaxID=519963 RepID=A0A232M7Y4_9EURO|nr:hypothetical protein Egran_00042 [Elaphomyces granulatus]
MDVLVKHFETAKRQG